VVAGNVQGKSQWVIRLKPSVYSNFMKNSTNQRLERQKVMISLKYYKGDNYETNVQ